MNVFLNKFILNLSVNIYINIAVFAMVVLYIIFPIKQESIIVSVIKIFLKDITPLLKKNYLR